MRGALAVAVAAWLPAIACGGPSAPPPAPPAAPTAAVGAPAPAAAPTIVSPTYRTDREPTTDAERQLAALAQRLAELPEVRTALTDANADQRELLRSAFTQALDGGAAPGILALLDAAGRVVQQYGVPVPVASEWLDGNGQVAWPALRAALVAPSRTIASWERRGSPLDGAIVSVVDAAGAVVGVALAVP